MAEILDLVDLEYVPDVVGQLWGHPHWDHGCEPVMHVSFCGLVYCADCASQIGSVPVEFSGLVVGRGGKAQRWLQHETIEQAWKAGAKGAI